MSDSGPLKIRVLVIEDNPDDVVLLNVRLGRVQDLSYTIDHVTTVAEAIEKAQAVSYDLVFVDYKLGPVESDAKVPDLRDAGLSCPMIALTGQGDEYVAASMIKSGADDYLVKADLPGAHFDEVLRRALSKSQDEQALRQQAVEVRRRLATLSPREREVLDEILAGLTSKEIAAKLHRSTETIKAHRAHILSKMQAGSTPELVRMVTVTGAA